MFTKLAELINPELKLKNALMGHMVAINTLDGYKLYVEKFNGAKFGSKAMKSLKATLAKFGYEYIYQFQEDGVWIAKFEK